ncbi:MAG: ComF family protein [Polaribacter sp.]|jgi:ComF family protein
MTILENITEGVLTLFFPKLCLACGSNPPPQEQDICIYCQYYLPKTEFHLDLENPFTERFWGRVKIEGGASLYYFMKNGRTQKLIHNLKYKGKRKIGIKLGELYGKDLRLAKGFENIDMILPVPLHPKKEHSRGYNQCDPFARGLSETMEIPWRKGILIKTVNNTSQTKMTRMERLENVRTTFNVNNPDQLRGKHVLIVDDVMTTGATLEACAEKVLEIPHTKVSLATIAMAKR